MNRILIILFKLFSFLLVSLLLSGCYKKKTTIMSVEQLSLWNKLSFLQGSWEYLENKDVEIYQDACQENVAEIIIHSLKKEKEITFCSKFNLTKTQVKNALHSEQRITFDKIALSLFGKTILKMNLNYSNQDDKEQNRFTIMKTPFDIHFTQESLLDSRYYQFNTLTNNLYVLIRFKAVRLEKGYNNTDYSEIYVIIGIQENELIKLNGYHSRYQPSHILLEYETTDVSLHNREKFRFYKLEKESNL